MTLNKNQDKTGFEREDSPNVEKKTGRPDGQEAGKLGYETEDSPPEGGKTGRDSGFRQTQGFTGYENEDSAPDKGSPNQGDPERVDEVRGI